MSKLYFNDHIIINSSFLACMVVTNGQIVSSKALPWDDSIIDEIKKNSLIVKRKFDVDSTGIIDEFVRF